MKLAAQEEGMGNSHCSASISITLKAQLLTEGKNYTEGKSTEEHTDLLTSFLLPSIQTGF